jgi:hypothetical protein
VLENRGGFRRPLEEIFNRSPAIRTSAQAQCLRAQRGEPYHLIIVGADITGLAAAHFNRPHARSSRILFSIITMTRRSRQAQRIRSRRSPQPDEWYIGERGDITARVQERGAAQLVDVRALRFYRSTRPAAITAQRQVFIGSRRARKVRALSW